MSLYYIYIVSLFYFTINNFALIMACFLLLVMEPMLALFIGDAASFVAVVAVSFILRNYKD